MKFPAPERRILRRMVLLFAALVLGACAGGPEPRSPSPVTTADPPPAAAPEPTLPPIGEDASLEDCRAHAALASPRLRAGFETWRAALERIPQVGSLPDPRFTFAWFVRSVETRVGPQKRRYALHQTFPWFGTLSLREDVASLNARAARHPVSLAFQLTWPVGALQLGGSLGVTLDYITRQVSARAANVVGEPAGADLVVSLSPMFHGRSSVFGHLYLFTELGAEIVLNNPRYVLATPDGRVDLLSPWPVRPRALVGLGFLL